MKKIAYSITHPQLGFQVLALPGETPVQAIARYNQGLGFDPSLTMPAAYPFNPTWTALYTTAQLNMLRSVCSSLEDPDTRQPITVAQYIANLPSYQAERQSPLPAEVWQA